jgi:hypothetical protein
MWDHEGHEIEYWQKRAEQARAMVPNLTSEESRRLMMQVAESYDRLTAKAESKKKL